MCTKFGVDSSSRFPFRARTRAQIDRQTRSQMLPPAWVIMATQWAQSAAASRVDNSNSMSVKNIVWGTAAGVGVKYGRSLLTGRWFRE